MRRIVFALFISILFLCVLTYNSSAQTGNLGYWTFDEANLIASGTAQDYSGNNRDLTVFSLGPQGKGVLGSALYFDGNNSYLRNNSINIPALSNFTILTWAKATFGYTESKNFQIFDFSNIGGPNVNSIAINKTLANTWQTKFVAAGVTYGVQYSDPSLVNKWTQFGTTRDGNILSLIINGQVVGTATANNNMNANITNLVIGADEAGVGSEWKGWIDDVHFFDYALSAEEIESLYQEGIPVSAENDWNLLENLTGVLPYVMIAIGLLFVLGLLGTGNITAAAIVGAVTISIAITFAGVALDLVDGID